LSNNKRVVLCGVPGMEESDIINIEKYVKEEYPDVDFEFLGIPALGQEEALEKLKDAQVLITWDQWLDEETYEKLNLRAYVAASTGFNAANIEAATKNNVVVSNAKDYCREEVAIHTVMFILSCARRLYEGYPDVKEGNWSFNNLGSIKRFSDSTVGFFGLGSIGSRVAEMLSGFNVKMIAYDPYASKEQLAKFNVEKVELETLYRESDYLTLHSPLTKETQDMINMDGFKLMKNTAYIINTSRGKNIKQDDLYEALKNGMIAREGLDVVYNEPPQESDWKLIELPNVMATPHSAFLSEEAFEDQIRITAQEVGRILRDEEPKNICNKEILDKLEWVKR